MGANISLCYNRNSNDGEEESQEYFSADEGDDDVSFGEEEGDEDHGNVSHNSEEEDVSDSEEEDDNNADIDIVREKLCTAITNYGAVDDRDNVIIAFIDAWEEAKQFPILFEEEMEIKGFRMLLFHHLIKLGCMPLIVLEETLEVYKEAMYTKCTYDADNDDANQMSINEMLPIHMVAKFCRPSHEIIEFFLTQYPESACIRTIDAKLPLSLVLERGQFLPVHNDEYLDIIKLLVDKSKSVLLEEEIVNGIWRSSTLR